MATHSPKTEGERAEAAESSSRLHLPRGWAAFFQRLNTRLVLAIASVALVGLIVSALAINQILPGYFSEQTSERLNAAAISAETIMLQGASEANDGVVQAAELRAQFIIAPAIELTSLFILPATYAVYDQEGRRVALSTPDNLAELRARGLRADPVRPARQQVRMPLPNGEVAEYVIDVSQPFTSREATLDRIRSAIFGAGLLALVAAVIFGAVAARRVTAPIHRLRRVAARVAQGDLEERATASGVLEVDELSAQFNVMADRLLGSLRMLEADRDRLREFVADVSHELRTPIAALRMYNELQRDGAVDDPTRAEFLERSTEQIGRLEWLSTNLLDLSRIDAGIFPLDMREGDLRDPVQAVVQALSEVAVSRGIGLDSAVPADPVELRFDRERVVQLMTNLIGNALKFTARGGAVSVRLSDEGDAVRVEVRDTGAGIPEDELPRVFERFYRGTNTGDARASGSGLGLAIVRSIVEMHGGEIDLESVVGQGTEFTITLPREAGKVNETSREAQPVRNQESPS
ncbi:MAG: HAMP domain-containing histidine kinase [Chloroflexi bacterium]|nr:HAMP domain-containing histidine kinase [Chloroflexota bacterium]